ncbi:hypothetical protein N7541_004579 [Penicillium brevicompactum]|uniref:Nucleotide-diphospho-sugar transferase n=1 Tax=Penicillium brevicompactum TaxID=5074 RepID=A0A9W9RC45_PENBR|nr:hypothetical protein N7541_004579 [Penicillium brevicompactum]
MSLPRQRTFPKPLQTIFLLFVGTFIVKTLVTLPCWELDSALGSLGHVDWSRFAYVQYATSTSHICNSLMIFESLDRLQAKADRVMIYPVEYSLEESDNKVASHLLRKARDQYNVKLVPAEIQSRASGDVTWASSFTKLLAFNQTQYDRVLSLDSDATVLQHMDELFLMQPCPVAMPLAYWRSANDSFMTSALMLVTPSTTEFGRVMNATQRSDETIYDMEIMNNLYQDRALVIPHDPYILLTGEFRSSDHANYLGEGNNNWNPDDVLQKAKYLHFSDWPVPKPASEPSDYILKEKQPSCHSNPITGELDDCRDRDRWLEFYADYSRRREEICGLDV